MIDSYYKEQKSEDDSLGLKNERHASGRQRGGSRGSHEAFRATVIDFAGGLMKEKRQFEFGRELSTYR